MKKFLLSFFVGSLVFSLLGTASAVTIDFDGLTYTNEFSNDIGNTYSEEGFTVSSSAGNFSVFGSSGANFSGTPALHNNVSSSVNILTRDGGGTFDIASIDLIGIALSLPADVVFTGNQLGGGVATQTLGMGTSLAFLGDFTELVSLTWQVSGVGGGPGGPGGPSNAPYQFDNIVVSPTASNPVPEPATVFLLGGAMLAVGGFRKKVGLVASR